MVKVKIDPRENCISDGVCIALCPDVFEWGDDGKSQIVAQYRVNDDIAEGNVPDDLKDCVKQAADSCPVQIIHIEE